MLILTEPARAETTAKNSRFLTEAVYADSAEKAREIWRFRKTQYDNGGRIVFAFITGPQGNVMGCSDDGEPSGTAGRPMLEVLKGSGITNIVITTARWFGGTKLGTGGLVRAFTCCAQTVLEHAKTAELVPVSRLKMEFPYPLYRQAKRLLDSNGFMMESEDFAENVHVTGKVRDTDLPALKLKLADLTGGKLHLDVLSGDISIPSNTL